MSGGEAAGLNAGGWLFLVTAWAGIVGVTAYCLFKLLKTQDRDR